MILMLSPLGGWVAVAESEDNLAGDDVHFPQRLLYSFYVNQDSLSNAEGTRI